MRFAFDPGVLALLLLGAGLYIRAVVRLSRRGYRVPRLQQAFWWTGMTLLTAGLLGPPAAYSDELFWAHMTEHLLIADLAAPFLLAGIRTPVGLFMPPKEVLVLVARNKPLRGFMSFLTKPVVALPVSVIILYGWHLDPAFTAATTNPWVHALQHQSFLIGNLLLWWPAIEPTKRPMPAKLWKVGYLLAGRMASILMGALFLVSSRPFYAKLYGAGDAKHGITSLTDQQIGASIMMVTDVIVMMIVLGIFFSLAAAEGARSDARHDLEREAPTT
ncbi:MAG: cytochrome c oxidase assembly protein [Solirubrobacterales bacterium]|nr:cytochrome c oxidase assembly protein [Solirubrobacterales bacterium]